MQITPIVIFNFFILVVFTLCFFYQLIYILIVLVKKKHETKLASKQHRFAFFISAHNEDKVIRNLVKSIRDQDYPRELIDIFVIADHCTDNTVEIARNAGATVYEYLEDVPDRIHGKSYVMDFGIRKVLTEYPNVFEAFFFFDADNVLSTDYVARMNEVFDEGYRCITSYRNSKNFGASWISAGYGIWFMREAKFLNNARMIMNTSCAISGTGYMISTKILEKFNGWPFHLITEDIEFSTYAAVNGIKIGYCGDAVFFDEQPVTFSASWKQRMRWTRGFYQVFRYYGLKLVKAAIVERRFAGYDMLMTIAPALILTITSALVNTIVLITSLVQPDLILEQDRLMALGSVFMTFFSMYMVFFLLGLLTTISERRQIYGASTARIVGNLFTFPLFMLSYVPIALVALFKKKVVWVPTEHNDDKSLDEIKSGDVK